MPDFLVWTVKEAAQKTGYNPEYIRRLIRDGKVEAVKIGIIILVKAESMIEYKAKAGETQDNRYGPKS